jgi:hypothetical protein
MDRAIPPTQPLQRRYEIAKSRQDYTPSRTAKRTSPVRKSELPPLQIHHLGVLNRPRPPRKTRPTEEIIYSNLYTSGIAEISQNGDQIPTSPTQPSYISPTPASYTSSIPPSTELSQTVKSRPSCMPRLSLSRPLPPAITSEPQPSSHSTPPSLPSRRSRKPPMRLSPLGPTRNICSTDPASRPNRMHAYPPFTFIHDAESPSPHITGWRSVMTTSRCTASDVGHGEADGICERVRLLNRLSGEI